MIPRVGQVVTIPTVSHGSITLDSPKEVGVNHVLGARGGTAAARLTVDRLEPTGFSSATAVRIDVDTAEAKAALAELTKEEAPAPSDPLSAPSSRMSRAVRRSPRAPRAASDFSREGDATG